MKNLSAYDARYVETKFRDFGIAKRCRLKFLLKILRIIASSALLFSAALVITFSFCKFLGVM